MSKMHYCVTISIATTTTTKKVHNDDNSHVLTLVNVLAWTPVRRAGQFWMLTLVPRLKWSYDR